MPIAIKITCGSILKNIWTENLLQIIIQTSVAVKQ